VIVMNKENLEFIAKINCDLGKNILSIGVASYFFKDMPLFFRIGFGILGLALILISIFLYVRKGEK
jgi:predicted membrane-bound dolichyl-phosphate-mannose-protein mannosyltransferase